MDTIRTTTIPNSAVVESPFIIHTTARSSSATDAAKALPIWDAMLSCIASAADTSYAMHNRTNGSTVDLIHGNMVGKKLFSVSIYPSRSITLGERPSWEE